MSQELETKNTEQETIVPEEPSTSTNAPPPPKKKGKPLRILLIFIVIAGLIYAGLHAGEKSPQVVAKNLYSGTILVSVRETVSEHFEGTDARVSAGVYPYREDYLVSHEEVEIFDAILEAFGFKPGAPVYDYILQFPIKVSLSEYNITEEATARVCARYQPSSDIVRYTVEMIDYPDNLYDISVSLTRGGADNYYDDQVDDSVWWKESLFEENSQWEDNWDEESDAETGSVEIYDAFLEEDYVGSPIIVISYDWTNTTDGNAAALWHIAPAAFQNGIGLEELLFYSNGIYESEMTSREIRPGATISLVAVFYLNDDYSDVEFEVNPWPNMANHPPIAYTTFYFN